MVCCCLADDSDACGERCDAFCPCIAIYPSMCTSFLSLVLAAVFAAVFGVYAFVSLRISIFRFDWPAAWLVIVNSAFLALILAALLLIFALLLWCTCSSDKRSTICKVFYLLGLILVVLGLCAVIFASIFIIYGASSDNTSFASQLETVWMDKVNDPKSTLPCRVQKQLACRGFEEGDCQKDSSTQNFTRCGTVCRAEDAEGGKPEFSIVAFPGCRERISRFYIQWNAVLLTGASVACILVLVAFFVTCASVTFDDDK